MTRSLMAVAVFALCACPPVVPTPDAGPDGGPNPPPIDACSGKCGVSQVCDPDRVCRDGCRGACDGGTFCQKVDAGEFSCNPITTTCGATLCEQGEVACIGGACSCLGPARGTFDSCFGAPLISGGGLVCGQQGECIPPVKNQQCKADSEPCGVGFQCEPVFGDQNGNDVCDLGDTCVCTKACSMNTDCDRGEACSGVGCLAAGLFGGQECAIQVDAGVVDDAGMHVLSFQTVTVASKCLRKSLDNGTFGNPTETEPTGTCTYSFFEFADIGKYPFVTCRPPGAVLENGLCEPNNWEVTAQAVQCGTALECAGMRGGNKGLCLRTCNALPPSVTYPSPQPSCNMGESCVNLYRREDTGHDGALLGVCTKKCNIFDAAQSQCPNYGSVPSVCVPTNPDGRLVASVDGSGICVPQRETIAMLDQPCDQSDPFKGASCGGGQICAPPTSGVASVCTKLCDTTCNPPADGGSAPARCATEVNATCPTGKSCRAVTSTTGARVGFCQ